MPDIKIIAVNTDALKEYLIQCNIAKEGTVKGLSEVLQESAKKPDLIFLNHGGNLRGLFKSIDSFLPGVPIVVLTEKPQKAPLYIKNRPLTAVIKKDNCQELINVINHLFLSLDKKQLEDKNEELGILVDLYENIAHQMIETERIDELLKNIMDRLKGLKVFDDWAYFIKDHESDILHLLTTSKKRLNMDIKILSGEGIAGKSIKYERQIVINSVKNLSGLKGERPLHERLKSTSIFAIPLKVKDSKIGVLELIKRDKNVFSTRDINILTKIARHIAIAIENVLLHQRMEELAITDDLTKIFNTRYLHRTLEIEIQRCKRYNTSVSLIFMDLDHFKDVNDKHGHLIGSKVLVEVAQLILNKIRSLDIVARYGGDEFVIVLPQTSSKYATQIAERLRKHIAETVFLKKEGYNIRLTASFGVASYPDTATSKEELLRLADEAMYKVKYQTKNGVYAIISHGTF
jgi:diguanylate cyclase (GGDEF)-like protein